MQQIFPPRMAVQRHGGREPASNRQGSKHVLGSQKQTVWLRTPGNEHTLQDDAWHIPCLPSGSTQVRLGEGQAGSPQGTWNSVQSLCLSDSWASIDPNHKGDCQWSTIHVPSKGLRSRGIRCPRRCIVYGENLETAKLVTQKELSAKGIAGLLSSASSPGESAALELEWQVVVERQAEHPLPRYSDSSYAPQECRPDLDEDGFVPVQGLENNDQDAVQMGDESSDDDTSEGMMEREIWYPDRSSMDDEQSGMFWNSVDCGSFASSEDPGTHRLRRGSSAWWRTASREELAALVAQRAQDCLENCDLPAVAADAPSTTVTDSRSQSDSSVWWRTAGKHELAALVAQRAADCLENCDLPTPQTSSQRKRQTASYELSNYEFSLSESVDKKLMASLFHKTHQTQLENLGLPAPLLNIIFGNTSTSVAPERSQKAPEPVTSEPQILPSDWKDTQRVSSISTSWCGEEGESSCFESEPGLLGQALCRSQTRAREAEKEARQARKAAEKANREKEQLAHMFCREAATLTYYRRRVTSLEAENFCLREFCKSNPVWIENSTFNPVKALDHLSRYHWRDTSKDQTIRYQFLKMPDRKQSSVKFKSDGSCVVMESTVGLAFTLGLSLAGAGLMLGWSMR